MSENPTRSIGRLSIVIPAYNEAHRIGRTLDELADMESAIDPALEVVVVDDGSTDETVAVCHAHLAAFSEAKLLTAGPNRGKGHAVRSGMLAATGDARLFMDADGSTALAEIPRFLEEAQQGVSDVIVASIGVGDATVDPQPWYRQVLGKLGNRLIRALVLPGIRDSQRGFKLFTAVAAEDVFSRCRIDGWLFDVEALVLARRAGYQVVERGVTWEHREESRVTARSYLRTLLDLLRLSVDVRRGRYGPVRR